MKIVLSLIAAALTLPAAAFAQERTAGQAHDAQVNWSALKNSIDLVSTQNKALAAMLDKMKACADKNALYKPADKQKDADGCVEVGLALGQALPVAPACGRVQFGTGSLSEISGRLMISYSGSAKTRGRPCGGRYNTPGTDHCSRTYDGKHFSACSCSRECPPKDTSDNSYGN